jgi:membrane protein
VTSTYRVIRATIDAFGRDNASTLAAAIAYYTLLSIFPLILGLVAILGVVVSDPAVRDSLINTLAGLFPGASDLISQTINEVVAGRGVAGLVATLGLLFSASGVFSAINVALNQVYHVPRQRSFIVNTLAAIVAVLAIGVVFLASLVLTAVLRLLATFNVPVLGISLGEVPLLLPLIGFLLPLVITIGLFAAAYRYVPNVSLTWGDVWPGALLAGLLFEVGKQLFAWYLSAFAHLNAVYGSLGAVIALVSWAYYAALLFLVGAELNATLGREKGSGALGQAPESHRSEENQSSQAA